MVVSSSKRGYCRGARLCAEYLPQRPAWGVADNSGLSTTDSFAMHATARDGESGGKIGLVSNPLLHPFVRFA